MPVTIVNNYTFPKKKKEQIEQKEEPIMVDDTLSGVLTPAPVVLENPGQFPSLSNNLQDELNSYLGRSKEAVSQILLATREKAEFLETLAEKARQDLEKEKHNISRLMGS
jgi:hypothetical protein